MSEHYSVDEVIAELRAENQRLREALIKALAMLATLDGPAGQKAREALAEKAREALAGDGE